MALSRNWPGAARCRPQGVTNEDQISITVAYEIQGGCVTGTGLGLKDAAEEKGPIPLGARALALRMRDYGTG
jgi:hypothetical protein